MLDDGEFRLYEVPEDAFLPRGATRRGANRDGGGLGDAPADDVDVRSSVVLVRGEETVGARPSILHDSRSPCARTTEDDVAAAPWPGLLQSPASR